jgi:hypothetical protein
MAYTLTDLNTCEQQILKLQTGLRLGDKSITYGDLDQQIRVRDMIRADLVAQGIAVPGIATPGSRPRGWRITTSKGL